MGFATLEQYTNGTNGGMHVWSRNLAITKVGLITSTVGLGPTSTTANFEINEADFSGYAAVDPTEVVSPNDAQTKWQFDISEVIFQHNGGATNNNIVGWFMVAGNLLDMTALPYGAASNMLVAYKFFTSVPMNTLGDEIRVKTKHIFSIYT